MNKLLIEIFLIILGKITLILLALCVLTKKNLKKA